MKYSPSFAARLQGRGVFTILAPGQSFNVRHDCEFRLRSYLGFESVPQPRLSVSSTYNFTLLGPGNRYRFEARNQFHYIGEDGEPVEIYAQSKPHHLSISGQLSRVRSSVGPNTSGLPTFIGCSPSREVALTAAAPVAQAYVAEALS